MYKWLDPLEKKKERKEGVILIGLAPTIIWIHSAHNICTRSRVNCEHMQICLCWFPSSSFVWLGQEHVALEGTVRTAIKAHFSGFCLARSTRGLSPNLTSASVFPFRFSLHYVPLCAWWRWIKMSCAPCGKSPRPRKHRHVCAVCARARPPVCGLLFRCSRARIRLMFLAQTSAYGCWHARSLPQIAAYRFPASLLEGEEGWRWCWWWWWWVGVAEVTADSLACLPCQGKACFLEMETNTHISGTNKHTDNSLCLNTARIL